METRFYSDMPLVSFDSMPELAGYTEEPPAMYVGCPGKCGYLKLCFEVDKDSKHVMSESERRAPLVVKHPMYFDRELPQMPCVYIQSSGGPNVDGDRYRQIFHVKKNAMAFVSTGAATKLAEMKHNYSGMKQSFELEEGAYMEFLPEPVIPHKHTRFISETDIVIHPSASLFYSEIYMPGRKYYNNGELYEYDVLSVRSSAARPDGEPLYREKFIIAPGKEPVRGLGAVSRYDVFGNVIALMPKDKSEEVYSKTEAFIDDDQKLACGISRLPNAAGLIFKILGMEPGPVKAAVRAFCSTVRQAVKGKPMMPEFSWR